VNVFLHTSAGTNLLVGLALIFGFCALSCAREAAQFHPEARQPWTALFWAFMTLSVVCMVASL